MLGVIGPTRMAYERVIPVVQATAEACSATALNPSRTRRRLTRPRLKPAGRAP